MVVGKHACSRGLVGGELVASLKADKGSIVGGVVIIKIDSGDRTGAGNINSDVIDAVHRGRCGGAAGSIESCAGNLAVKSITILNISEHLGGSVLVVAVIWWGQL